MRKIKVFLGGYVNYSNAQNLNCQAIAENLDPSKFEVYALRVHYGNNTNFDYNTFFCFWPFSFSFHLGFLWGLINADVLYLPKHTDTPIWLLKISNFLKKPIFTTIEGNVTDLSTKYNLINLFSCEEKMCQYFSHFNAIFGITNNIVLNSRKVLNIRKDPLALGVNSRFRMNFKRNNLSSIIFIGRLTNRKRVDEFIKLARSFPKLNFKVVGDGPELNNLLRISTENIKFLGKLDQSEIKDMLKYSDLMFLPSKSEGFPKVILEAAYSGVPSIIYNNYGASDWMTNNVDGFIVNTFQEVNDVVDKLVRTPKMLEKVSENAFELAARYDWNFVIKDWQKVIEFLFNER